MRVTAIVSPNSGQARTCLNDEQRNWARREVFERVRPLQDSGLRRRTVAGSGGFGGGGNGRYGGGDGRGNDGCGHTGETEF